MTPNIYVYSADSSKHVPTLPAGFHSAEATVHVHGGDVSIGRWKTLGHGANAFQTRTIRAIDKEGRVVELVQYRDVA